ncbi:ceramidase [Rhodobacter sp. JA431]|uniref:ceramidase domain-containing protein n=1 Tax=Rhodobacter sp. JA431 TaxID=570013 RepID=UPI000BD56153|nr:ceramidase domain-containing protein [Rhodobacter sp. JA431]SOC10766.1 ceramidase [Rhodobacter sp. JA431]
MDWFTPVDIYCERLGPGFWAEPLNAISNLSFPLFAALAALTARTRGTDLMGWVLIVMAALIGVGSFLFHTFANRWSELADVLPIWSFVAVYIIALTAKLRAKPPPPAVVAAIALAAVATLIFLAMGEGTPPETLPAAPTKPDPLNGSGQYAPAVIAMAVFGIIMFRRRHPQRWWLAAAVGTFLLSLTFRTLDRDICTSLPQGTHFLWHLLNGAMIGMILQLYLRVQRPPAEAI